MKNIKININKELSKKNINKIIEDKNTINLIGKKSTNQRIKMRKYNKIEKKANKVIDILIILGLGLICLGVILIGILKALIWITISFTPKNEPVEIIKEKIIEKKEEIKLKIPTIADHIKVEEKKVQFFTKKEEKLVVKESFITEKHQTDEFVINKAIEFLKKHEGVRLKSYWDYKQYSICFGTKSYKGEIVTLKECEKRLKTRVQSELLRINRLGDNLKWNKKVALISFFYNAGYNYKILSYAARLDDNSVKFLVLQYNSAGGKFLQGLQNRRYEEMNYYLK